MHHGYRCRPSAKVRSRPETRSGRPAGSPLPSPVVADLSIRLAEARRRRGDPRDLQPRGARRRRARSTSSPASLAEQEAWLAARSGAFSAIVAVDDAGDGRRVRLAVAVQGAGRLPHDGRGLGLRRPRPRRARASGRLLLTRLLDVARASGFHAVMARIEAGGTASRALHARCGFELVGIEREVGRKFNRWLDVAVMQRLL